MKFKFHVNGPVLLLTFCLFAACAVMTVMTGAKVYQNVIVRDSQIINVQIAQQYLTAKLRRMDDSNLALQVKDWSQYETKTGPILALTETIEDRDYQTLIYCHNGKVYELFTAADAEFAVGDGQSILDAENLSFTNTGRGILISMTIESQPYQFYVTSQCREFESIKAVLS